MRDAYQLVGLAMVGVLGVGAFIGLPERWGVGRQAHKRLGTLTASVLALVSMAFISVVFLADKLIAHGGTLPLSHDSELLTSGSLTFLLISVGVSGVATSTLLEIVGGGKPGIQRWAGGCLLASVLMMLSLFPATLAFVFSVAESATQDAPEQVGASYPLQHERREGGGFVMGELPGDYVSDIIAMAGKVWLAVGVTSILGRLCWNGFKGVPRPRREAFSWATNVASSAAMATALLMFVTHIVEQRLAEKGIAAAVLVAISMGAAVVLLPKLFALTKRE